MMSFFREYGLIILVSAITTVLTRIVIAVLEALL